MPFFAVLPKKLSFLTGYWTESQPKFYTCREIHDIYFNPLKSELEHCNPCRNHDEWRYVAKIDDSVEKLVSMATFIERLQNNIPGYKALLYAYQSWNFGEDRSIGFWDIGLESRSAKKIYKKNIGKIYSPFSKFAEHAKTYNPPDKDARWAKCQDRKTKNMNRDVRYKLSRTDVSNRQSYLEI